MKSLLWFGPVSILQVQPTVPVSYELDVLGCLGNVVDGKPTCADRAETWKDAAGRRIPQMRKAMRLPAQEHFLAAFSAGGQVVKRLCQHPTDMGEIRGIYLADAVYTSSWAHKPTTAGTDTLLQCLVNFALAALADGRWLVATSSGNPNGPYPSGSQSLASLRTEIEQQSGRTFEDAREDELLKDLSTPAMQAFRMCNLLLVDFGLSYSHGAHPLQIAPVLLPRVLAKLDE